MTMPDERARALLWARKLLKDVALCEEAPAHLRKDARFILRHYPLASQVEHGAHLAPDFLRVDKADKVMMRALEEAGNEDRFFEPSTDRRFKELRARFRQAFAGLSEAEVESLIDEALTAVRHEHKQEQEKERDKGNL